jgi:putative FmdB family regulatory protein
VPIYDYVCSTCGHLTEVVHGINDHGPKFCPECGAEGTMTKAFAPPTIHFKGSGWAKKDRSASSSSSRGSSSKKDESTAKAGASGSDSGSGSGSGSPSSSGSTNESGSSSGDSSSSAAGD